MAKKIDREVLAGRIRELEGLSMEERSALLELLNTKRYGLVWENHVEDAEEHLREYLPVLKEETSKALTNGGEDAPNHILIEGDNLDALTALTYTHEGKVDVIYIDPPYNTGNKDFVYNDSFVDSEDGYRHSKWLSFMEKRLRIAKKLLSDKGVIFISIDDNEQANLKLLCDEVFGKLNFIAKFDWRKKTGANDAKDIAVITESILLYSKNRFVSLEENIWNRDDDSINNDRYKYSDEFEQERGKFYYDTLDRGGLQYSDSMNYGIEAPDGGIIYPNGRNTFVNDGWIWKWGQDKVKWGIENKFLEFVKSKKSKGSQYTIKYKVYQNVDNEGNIREKAGRAYSNLIIDPINQQGNAEMKMIFNNTTPFSNPKPAGLIKYILKIIKNSNLILDFFAGSGTTLHATMQLNKEDGGHRQCILVQAPEPTYEIDSNGQEKPKEGCKVAYENGYRYITQITYERNKRVINGYTTPKGEKVEGLHENNLRYYKVDFVPRDSSLEGMRKLMEASTDLLCIKHDLYHEEHTFGSLKLKPHIARYFKDDDKQVLIIYKVDAIARFVREIAEMPEGANVMVYVFSINNYAMDADFEAVADKVTLCALPAAIYNAYLKVLPKKKIPIVEEKEPAEPTLFDGEEDKL